MVPVVRKPHIFQVLQSSGFCGWKTTCLRLSESVVIQQYLFFGRLKQYRWLFQPVVVWFWNWTIYCCFNLWFLWFRQHKSAACSV